MKTSSPKTIEPTWEGDYAFPRNEPFRLTGGGALPSVTLRYTLYGALNEAKDNAVLACHALSGSSRVGDWWTDLFGEGKPFDLTRRCVIGVNIIGSCYGSTGPCSFDEKKNQPYGVDFPVVSITDVVRAQARLIEHLGINQLSAVIGGSIGGMQALEWAVAYPEKVRRCVAIGAAPLSAMGLALNHLQRLAVMNDLAWRGGRYDEHDGPRAGLALARAIAMCSYKSAELFDERFGRRPDRAGEDPRRSLQERYDVAGYLDYQGSIFNRRFDANTYLTITKAMDTFDLARSGETEEEALRRVKACVTLIGISSDWLFPARDVASLAARMRDAGVAATDHELQSSHGHDGFLAEAEQLIPLVNAAFDEANCRRELTAVGAV